jgi:hypothetical protein
VRSHMLPIPPSWFVRVPAGEWVARLGPLEVAHKEPYSCGFAALQ